MMISWVVDNNRRKLVVFTKESVKLVSLVVFPGGNGSIGIATNKEKRVRILFTYKVNGVLEERQVSDELRFATRSSEVDRDVNAGLVAWLLKDKSQNTTGGRFEDRNIGIKIFLPQDKSTAMRSRFKKRKKTVMSIFGVEEVAVLMEVLFQNKRSIRKM